MRLGLQVPVFTWPNGQSQFLLATEIVPQVERIQVAGR